MISHVLILFLIILAGAFALYTFTETRRGATHIITMCLMLSLVIMFAFLDKLFLGCAVACILAVAAFLAAAAKTAKEKNIDRVKSFFSPATVMFILSSLFIIFYFGTRQPIFSTWDEFSFWGTAQKLTKIHNAIYTYYESSMIGNTTPPALTVLAYFFQFFTEGFRQWVSYVSYDIMFFACYRAAISKFDWKKFHVRAMGYIALFFSVYFFRIYTRIVNLETIYMCTLRDIPLAVIACGAFRVYYTDKKPFAGVLKALPIIFFLTDVKDMGFAFSNILALVIFLHLLFVNDGFSGKKITVFFKKLGSAALVSITSVTSFAMWTVHMSKVMSVNRFELGGEAEMGMAEMLIAGVTQLFAKEPLPKFASVKRSMIDAFFTWKMSIFGRGYIGVIIITAVFLLAFIRANKQMKKHIRAVYAGTAIGFVGYYVFHIFLYVFIFKASGYELDGYARYISSYYTFWLMVSVCVLIEVCLCANLKKLAEVALAGITSLILFIQVYAILPQNAFYGYSELTFAKHRKIEKKADTIKDAIGWQDRIYLIAPGDDGETWFLYTYELAENVIYRDYPQLNVSLTGEEMEQNRKDFAAYLKEHGITNLMIDSSDSNIADYFGDYIDVNPNTIGVNQVYYYKVEYLADGNAEYSFIKAGTVDEN